MANYFPCTNKKGNVLSMKHIEYCNALLVFFYIITTLQTISLFSSEAELFAQGNELLLQQQYNQAVECYTKALNNNHHCYQALYNAGYCYLMQHKYQAAADYFKKSITTQPAYAKAYAQLGICFCAEHSYEHALKTWHEGILHDPACGDLHRLIIRMHNQDGNYDAAEKQFERALEHCSQDSSLLLEYAHALCAQNKNEKAYEIYKRVQLLEPDSIDARYNIAYALKRLGKHEDALLFYQHIVNQQPDHANAHFGVATTNLILGNLQRGFDEYEWRWKRGDMAPRTFKQPIWDGSSLEDKTILLHAEQGFGDTFQFIRYAQITQSMGARTIVVAQPALFSILSLCPYIDQVIVMGKPIPLFDVHAPLLSLPRIIKTSLDTIPSSIPYLYADEKLTQQWCSKFSKNAHFKIGICWQGNTGYTDPFLQSVVAQKSISAQLFKAISEIEGVQLYSLQRESNGFDDASAFSVITFDKEFDRVNGRFMDTAAVIKNLDLVITVDTSIAHLAGGLGAPVWVLLPEPCDWRWLCNRSDSPWYPTMKLFRQSSSGNWDSVLQNIYEQLKQLVIEHTKKHTTSIQAEVSVGELVDKITILELKKLHFSDEQKLKNIEHELEILLNTYRTKVTQSSKIKQLKQELYTVNKQLWDIEDAIRNKERHKSFDQEFISIARSVYVCNDKRCHIKGLINEQTQSDIIEEKSYAPY